MKPTSYYAPLIAIVAIFAAIVLYVGVSASSWQPPTDASIAKSEAAAPIQVGDTGTITGSAPAAATKETWDAMENAKVANDQVGFTNAYDNGGMMLDSGTKVLLIGANWGGTFEVRVQSGPHSGLAAWLASGSVVK